MFVALVTSVPADAISIDCAPRPADPTGYEIKAVHADAVTAPAGAIAILDSGVASVPELGNRLRPGYNVAGGDRNTNDIDGHGTSVASIAAAAAGGVRGVAPTSPIIPIKIFDDRGQSAPEDLAAGIAEAIDRKAGVINVSASALPAEVDN